MKYAILSLLLLASCGNPLNKEAGALRFSDSNEAISAQRAKTEALEVERKKFLADKKRVWVEINTEAKETFKDVSGIIENKCFSCHDANTKLPFYGRFFKKINPVNKHQTEGLKALDFAPGFPFTAQGNPPTIALLKSIKNAFIEKSMPLKSFTVVYPNKKITEEDQRRILDWINPVIDHFTEYDLKYNTTDTSVPAQATKILELKCFRCHANGNHRGDFGNMENIPDLLKSKYVNLERVEDSKLFTSVSKGEMPPSKLEKLTIDEINTVRDWLELVAKNPVGR